MKAFNDFPVPSEDAQALSLVLTNHIKSLILLENGVSHGVSHGVGDVPKKGIPFSRFFDACLYTAGLGYYDNGLKKIGPEGDFITAPELTPLFSYCIANQLIEIAEQLLIFDVLEIGAGTGKMCADILDHLKAQNRLPKIYYILERSSALKIRQQALLAQRHPEFLSRIIWLDQPPTQAFQGIIIGNEIIDALAVERFIIERHTPFYLDVALDDQNQFIWQKRQADEKLLNLMARLQANGIELPEGYVSEFCPQLAAFVRTISENMAKGAILLIDYGYAQKDYYHPLRNTGTLIAHYQHRAHEHFFERIGLQDITANVDFTALSEAALAANLDILGFTHQSLFLYGADLEGLLKKKHAVSSDLEWFSTAQKIQQLILPSEMGERFHVLLLGKNITVDHDYKGFKLKDFRHLL